MILYDQQIGAGTELKRILRRPIAILGWLGFDFSRCRCDERALIMDLEGPRWCRANVETIVEWLREAAQQFHLPFSYRGARFIILRAIRRAEYKLRLLGQTA
jgi:hypothetical protein